MPAVPTAQSFRLAAHCRVLPKYRCHFRSEVMLWHRALVALLSADVQFSYFRRSAQTMALISLPLWRRHMLLRLR